MLAEIQRKELIRLLDFDRMNEKDRIRTGLHQNGVPSPFRAWAAQGRSIRRPTGIHEGAMCVIVTQQYRSPLRNTGVAFWSSKRRKCLILMMLGAELVTRQQYAVRRDGTLTISADVDGGIDHEGQIQ